MENENPNSKPPVVEEEKVPDSKSDPDEKICNIFEVIKEKSMYGKKYMGIERSTFLIDANGKLAQEWRKVKVKGHALEVLNLID